MRKRNCHWLLAVSFFSSCCVAPQVVAQILQQQPSTAYPQKLTQELAAIRDKALSSDYAYQQTAYLTENIGPRMSGSPQAAFAVQYVAGELRKLGLDVRFEPVLVPHWVRGQESAELVGYPGQAPGSTQKIVLTALSGSSATPANGITAGIVVVNSFTELKALGRARVAGKIVVFNVPFDQRKAAAGYAGEAYGEAVTYRVLGEKAAGDLGAAASLIRSVGEPTFVCLTPGTAAPPVFLPAPWLARMPNLSHIWHIRGRSRCTSRSRRSLSRKLFPTTSLPTLKDLSIRNRS